MRKSIFIALLGVLAVILASGCGGSSDSSASGDSTLTRAEFIKKADAACTKVNGKQSRAVQAYSEEKPPPEPGRSREEQLYFNVVLPNVEENLKQLGEMETPAGDEQKVQAIVEANEEALDAIAEDPSKLKILGKDPKSPFIEATKLAMAYGFKICGEY